MRKEEVLRKLPAVHDLVHDIALELNGVHEKEITRAVQDTIAHWRNSMLQNEESIDLKTDLRTLIKEDAVSLLIQPATRVRSVINASGVVLHTNLGRARLSEKAVQKMAQSAQMYSNLEFNLKTGKRGSRHDLTEELIQRVTGAQAAMVVNNNAAAVYLILKALAKDKEVIVSRGELVEIGGSFRISSIMEESGAFLREIGTTNKTHFHDYDTSVNENTAMIMKVHTSNFKTIGFTKNVSSGEIMRIKEKHPDVVVYEDLGSGALFPFHEKGIGDEPLISSVIESGVDLISFSGDKLLGGPQAGIVAGKKEYIDKLKKHQLARVLRVDKFTIAALQETLNAYLNEEFCTIPTIRDILRTAEEIKERSLKIIGEIGVGSSLSIKLLPETSQVGGGTMPGVELATYCIALTHKKGGAFLSKQLRAFKVPIIVRIKDDEVLIDLRTVSEQEEALLLEAIHENLNN
jgi:L-seryl-tRNA(Ser) seleniumtransferase